MTTYPHGRTVPAEPMRPWLSRMLREMWASLAIVVMWLAVLLDALFGPDLVTSSAGGDTVTIPSAVLLGLFAFLGTWVVARYGFARDRLDPD